MCEERIELASVNATRQAIANDKTKTITEPLHQTPIRWHASFHRYVAVSPLFSIEAAPNLASELSPEMLTVAVNDYTFAVLALKYLKRKNLGEFAVLRGLVAKTCVSIYVRFRRMDPSPV